MRDIKFRAWWQHPLYNEDGSMYGVAGIVWGTPDEGEPEYKLSLEPVQVALVDYPLVENYQKLGWNKQCKLMQYTGLKDKEGVEIYEGDIIDDGLGAGVVEYCQPIAAFVVRPIEQSEYEIYQLNKGNTIGPTKLIDSRVIGNVYENPELLDTTNTPPGQ